MQLKKWYQSTTLWFNILAAMLYIAQILAFVGDPTVINDPHLLAIVLSVQGLLLALANYILRRFKTSTPIQ